MANHRMETDVSVLRAGPEGSAHVEVSTTSAGERLQAARQCDRRQWEARTAHFRKQVRAYYVEEGYIRFSLRLAALGLVSAAGLALLPKLLDVFLAWQTGPTLLGNLLRIFALCELGLFALGAALMAFGGGLMGVTMCYCRWQHWLIHRQARLEGLDLEGCSDRKPELPRIKLRPGSFRRHT